MASSRSRNAPQPERVIRKLASAARENHLSGLVAFTSPRNRGMIKLFNELPYKVQSSFDGDMLTLRCKFDEPA